MKILQRCLIKPQRDIAKISKKFLRYLTTRGYVGKKPRALARGISSLAMLAVSLFMACIMPAYSQQQSAYLIVHCHNPEGKEIASVQGMQSNCVRIYNDDAQIGSGVSTVNGHNKPITISAGQHTIKAEFNGMTKQETVTLTPDETKTVTFTFEREEVDLNQILNKQISGSVSVSHEVWYDGWGYSQLNLVFGESSSPGYWREEWRHGHVYIGWEYHTIVHGELTEPWWDLKHWTAGFKVNCTFDCNDIFGDPQTFTLNANYSAVLTPDSFSGDFSYSHNGVEHVWEGNHIIVIRVDASIGFPQDGINLSAASFLNSNFQEWYSQGIIPDYSGNYAVVKLLNSKDWYVGDGATIIPGTGAKPGYCFNEISVNPSRPYDFLQIQSAQSLPFKNSIFTGFKVSSIPYDLTGTAIGDEEIPNLNPQAEIISISPNPVELGGTITFRGTGRDSDGTVVGYNWRSSLDGQISEQASFSSLNLSKGTHTIYFKVKDNEGAWSDEVSQSLVVSATDSSSDTGHGKNRNDDENDVGEPVNIVNGNMYTIKQDISLPGRGLGFNFQRCYNSQKAYLGPLGYGWTHSYNVFLEVLELGDKKIRITQEDGRAIYFIKQPDGSFAAPKGEYSRLTKESKGYIWRLKNGVKYYFNFDFYDNDLSEKPASVMRDIYYINIPVSIIEDRNHNQIRLTYKAYNNLISITDSAGRKITFSYTGGRLSRITDPAGNTLKYNYDASGNLIQVTDLRGETTAYEYDTNHNLSRIIGPNGHSVYFEYDGQDRCIVNYYDNNTLRCDISYDPDNRKTTITDSRGAQTTKTYNADGLVTQVQEADGNSRYYTWDADYNRTAIKDKNGNRTLMSYDSLGNLLSITDARNNTTAFEYEPDYSFISRATDCQGNTTTSTYDSNGNLICLTNALGDETRYAYNNSGQLINVEDAQSHTMGYDYDSSGNLILTTDAIGNQTRSNYDILGRCISVTDARGNTTNYEYD
ncbi:MAG: DUF6531 domain-containing protein, partial [Planctomycetota bacterium]